MSASDTPSKKTVLVTGGTGLVGKAVQAVVERRRPENEEWVFLSSKDGDLRCGRCACRARALRPASIARPLTAWRRPGPGMQRPRGDARHL